MFLHACGAVQNCTAQLPWSDTPLAQSNSVNASLMSATAGRPLPVKKRGGVKPRKKETVVASKRGTKGNIRAGVPTTSPAAFREVVGEGGLPAADGQREQPAAGRADQAAAAAGAVAMETAGAVAVEPAAGTNVLTSMAPQQGVYCQKKQSLFSYECCKAGLRSWSQHGKRPYRAHFQLIEPFCSTLGMLRF